MPAGSGPVWWHCDPFDKIRFACWNICSMLIAQPLESVMDTPRAAPATIEAFRDRLAEVSADLPRRMRQCAEFIATHSDRIAVSTVADIASGADVPPSAVMRFCQILGFSGFSEMQKLFREAYAPGFPDYATRLRNLKTGEAGRPSAILAEFVEAGRLSLETLTKSLDEAALDAAVAVLSQAGTVHIVGRRRSFPIAAYFAYIFDKLGVPAILHDGVGQLDCQHSLRKGDAMIAVTFAPYAEETLTLAQTAYARNVPFVLLTDRVTSPLSRLAAAVLTITEVDFGAFRAPTATIAVAVALAVAVAAARGVDQE
jgi:DNA-binding MurR/RpiR family transcriptional regulator